MSQLTGTSRHPTPFSVPPDTDEKLQQMLALYKAPATIRDMKQVYFYAQVESNITRIAPLTLFYNVNDATLTQQQFYYAPMGTTRQLNIADKVNDLIDIRVPKDKYVIEINLVECVIEADSSSWTKIPDRVVRLTDSGATLNIEPTFNWSDTLSVPDGSTPPRQTITSTLQQATKLSQPQTLYCRIKELSNGEPFNWSVTNSGAFSIDKSHQLLVRHGDINYAKLTLEFGHLLFTGLDQEYENLITDVSNQNDAYARVNQNAGVPKITKLKDTYRDYKYVDYNSEVFNTLTKEPGAAPPNPYPDDVYPTFYKGDGGINWTTVDQVRVAGAKNLVQPANRVPFEFANDTTPYNVQGKPLLFNQQASKIGFRWLIRIVHLF